MSKIPQAEADIHLARLELPVNIIMVQTAVACAGQVAELLSFDKTARYNLEVSVEEAFTNAVLHFHGIPDSSERIFLEFYIQGESLIVSIRENGIPFDRSESKRYVPRNIEDAELPGLGMLLMSNRMDSVELLVHGRQGKETRLTKKIRFGDLAEQLTEPLQINRKGKRISIEKSHSRVADINDLPEITRLAWRCYGYTQEELLYNLDLLTEKFVKGEIQPIVFFDPETDTMMAHEALKYHDPSVKVSELGLAFLDPAYRCPNQSVQFADEAKSLSRSNGDLGMFDCSVTTHTFSQKAMQEHVGSSPCSILIGIAAQDMKTKSLATKEQKKGTTINHYLPFNLSPKTVFMPDRHKAIVEEIYDWMKLPRTVEVSSVPVPKVDSEISVFPLPDELNVSFIVVHSIGSDAMQNIKEALQQTNRERKDAVYLFLPACSETLPALVEQSEKLGFSFAGIMPHIHGGDDRLLMQKVHLDLNLAKIRVYGDRSRKLLSYILDEKERCENPPGT